MRTCNAFLPSTVYDRRVKECLDATEGIIILSAMTIIIYFINRKKRFISRHYSVYLRTDEIFRLSRSEKKSRSLSLDAFLARFRSQVYIGALDIIGVILDPWSNIALK